MTDGANGPLNLGAAVRSKDQKYFARIFVNNVADGHYFVDVEDFWSRYAGVRLEAKF